MIANYWGYLHGVLTLMYDIFTVATKPRGYFCCRVAIRMLGQLNQWCLGSWNRNSTHSKNLIWKQLATLKDGRENERKAQRPQSLPLRDLVVREMLARFDFSSSLVKKKKKKLQPFCQFRDQGKISVAKIQTPQKD